MTAFDNASKFFAACEEPKGWDGCKEYVADGATFTAQAEPLASVTTIQEYCDWMLGIGSVTAPGATYEVHSASYDEATRTAVFFATYHARHTGDGGPVPPTNKETHSHYDERREQNCANDQDMECIVGAEGAGVDVAARANGR